MSVDPRRVEELFSEALERPRADRENFLRSACGADVELRREVESLLAAQEGMGGFLEGSEVGGGLAAALGSGSDLVGRTVGRYRVVDVVARGGMGVVYRAEQKNPDRSVALKLMARGLASPDLRKRFEVEVQVLGRLQHPAIAQIFEAGTAETDEGPRPFFAMEFIDGLPLTDWAAERDLDLRRRVALFLKVCGGVQHAHQKGVLHRDLKPANILVDRDGQPRVLDFGVARGTDADLQVTTIEEGPGSLLGTLPYMSPEQLGGRRADLDTRSDVYSLGVVLYELLTGGHPHDLRDRSLTDAIRVITGERPRSLAAAGRPVPGDVETIVAKALAAEPSRRYDAVSALAADLQRFLDDEPIAARPPSMAYHVRKLIARNRLASGLAGVLLVLLAGFGVAMALQARRVAAERDRATREADTAREVASFLQELFAVPDPGSARGNTVTAREILDRGARRIESELTDQPGVQARLMVLMGSVYRNLGLQGEAARLLEAGIDRSRTAGGTEPETLVEGLRSLAWARRNAGDHDGAVAVAREALETAERTLGPDHGLRGQVLTALGVALRDRGDLDEAEDVLGRSLRENERLHGTGSVHMATALYHVGWLEHRQGRHDKASRVYQRACPMLERALEADHPDVAWCFNDHSVVLSALQDHEGAQEQLRRALAVWERVLPAGHPTLAAAVDNLGSQFLRSGEYESAAEQYRRAIAIREGALGADHVDVGATLYNLALAERGLRQWDAAEEHFLRSNAIVERVHGPDDPRLVNQLFGLAQLYLQQGRFQDALRVLDRCLASRESTLGPDHLWVAGALQQRAAALMLLERHREAEAALLRARAIAEAKTPPGNRGRASIVIDLGLCYERMGRLDAAEEALETARGDLEDAGMLTETLAGAYLGLARVARRRGDEEGARDLLQRALERRRESPSPDQQGFLYLDALAAAAAGDGSRALDSLRRSLDGGFLVFLVDAAIDFPALAGDPELEGLLAAHAP